MMRRYLMLHERAKRLGLLRELPHLSACHILGGITDSDRASGGNASSQCGISTRVEDARCKITNTPSRLKAMDSARTICWAKTWRRSRSIAALWAISLPPCRARGAPLSRLGTSPPPCAVPAAWREKRPRHVLKIAETCYNGSGKAY
jgi:hypothetical protein